jgi:ribosomal protein S18 acetylase RimI-like enzyme
MLEILDNITWHSLAGPHARFSSGGATARRYARGFSPILGFADPAHPDFEALGAHCGVGESFYTDGWSGPAPRGWSIKVETTMFKMVWDASAPSGDPAADAMRLDARHAAQAVALAELTHPGPFALRTIELGEYFGYLEDGRLVAMAGERMQGGALHEISGVCTHPDLQGRGFARRLVLKLIGRQVRRGETPFLHVMRDNTHARGLYQRMGFREYRESVVRVVERVA